jgi:hypothetical protein
MLLPGVLYRTLTFPRSVTEQKPKINAVVSAFRVSNVPGCVWDTACGASSIFNMPCWQHQTLKLNNPTHYSEHETQILWRRRYWGEGAKGKRKGSGFLSLLDSCSVLTISVQFPDLTTEVHHATRQTISHPFSPFPFPFPFLLRGLFRLIPAPRFLNGRCKCALFCSTGCSCQQHCCRYFISTRSRKGSEARP